MPFIYTDKKQMYISIFNIVSLYGDAVLASFNKLLHPFQKVTFQFVMKPHLHHLLVWATNAYTFYASCQLSYIMACADLQLKPTISATYTNVIYWCTLIKVSTLCMCSSTHDVDGQTKSTFICYSCSSHFKVFQPLVHLSWCILK